MEIEKKPGSYDRERYNLERLDSHVPWWPAADTKITPFGKRRSTAVLWPASAATRLLFRTFACYLFR